MKVLLSKIYLASIIIAIVVVITYMAFVERSVIAQFNFIMLVMIVIMLGIAKSIEIILKDKK